MIDHSYTMIIEAEALKAQINFIEHNSICLESKTMPAIERIYGKKNGEEYNSYVKLVGESKPLRGRSEVIVLKGDKIFLRNKYTYMR